MLIRQMWSNFGGGEVSPFFYSRPDLPFYNSSCKILRNFFVTPGGGARRRPGTLLVEAAKATNKKARLIPFVFSDSQAYVIEFGDGYIRFFKDKAKIGDPYEIDSPYSESDLPNINFTQIGDLVYLADGAHTPRHLVRYGDQNWAIFETPYINGPFMGQNITPTSITPSGTTGTISLSASSSIFSNISGREHWGGNTLFRISHYIPAGHNYNNWSANGESGRIKCGGTWRIKITGDWMGKVVVSKSLDNGSTWIVIENYNTNTDTFKVEEDDQFLLKAAMTGYVSGICRVELKADAFEWVGIAKIKQVPAGSSAGGGSAMFSSATAEVITPLGDVKPTKLWAEGAWSKYRGYPKTLAFFQDRLFYANTIAEPQSAWGTKTGQYVPAGDYAKLDFGRSDPLQDDDGITVALPSKQISPIQNMVSLNKLLILTAMGDWSIGPGSQGGPLTPATVSVEAYGNEGAAYGVDPVVIGNRVIYAQYMQAAVRDTSFDLNQGGFTGKNLMRYASHLLEGHYITEMAYWPEPYSMLLAIREDGKLLSMTYEPELGIENCWAWHDTGPAGAHKFESVCVIPGEDGYEVWFIVNRSGTRYIERFADPVNSTEVSRQYFVDCGEIHNPDEKVITNIEKVDGTGVPPFDYDKILRVTCPDHGYSNQDFLFISQVKGSFGERGGQYFFVANVTQHTFDIYPTGDATDFPDYISGGIAQKGTPTISGLGRFEQCADVMLLYDSVAHEAGVYSGMDSEIQGGVLNATISGTGTYPARVTVGFNFISEIKLLAPELNLQSGTLQGKKYKFGRLTARLSNSMGGKIGFDEETAVQLLWPDGSYFSPVIPSVGQTVFTILGPLGHQLYSGDFEQAPPSEYKGTAQLYFRQDEPYPSDIIALIGEINAPS